MPDPSEPSKSDSAAAPDGMGKRLLKAADLVGRVLLSLVVIFGAFYCLQIVLQLRSTGDRIEALTSQASPGADAIDSAMRDMVSGSWQFAGMPWEVSARELPEDEAMNNLLSPLPVLAEAAAPGLVKEESMNLDLIMETLEMMGAEAQVVGSHTIYAVDQPNLRARAVAPKDHARQVQYARVVQRSGNGLWNFIEISANQSEPTQKASAISPLLPRAPDALRLALRTDVLGVPCGELIELGESLSEARQRWESVGWRIEVFQGGNLVEPSKRNDSPLVQALDRARAADALQSGVLVSGPVQSDEAARVLVCTREAQVVIVVPSTPIASENETVLLVRAPE